MREWPGSIPLTAIRHDPRGPILVGRPSRPEAPGTPLGVSGLVLPGRFRIPRGFRLPPAVGGAPYGLIQPGDWIGLDGHTGWLRLDGVRETTVVTSFLLRSDGRLLLGRRSRRVSSFRGRWAGISGFMETDPLSQAYREIEEETGLHRDEIRLERRGAPLYTRNGSTAYRIHPFLFRVAHPKLRRDWEHVEFRWVRPEVLDTLRTVPRLRAAWEAVAPRAPRGNAKVPSNHRGRRVLMGW